MGTSSNVGMNQTAKYVNREITPSARESFEVAGVDYMLEGLLQIHDGGYRINVRLADAKSGFQLWAEQFSVLGPADDSARRRAELAHVRVHDLKHTFGRRLRAAGVSYKDRQDLLGHRSGRLTTHHSRVSPAKLPHYLLVALVMLKKKTLTAVAASA